MKKIIKNYSLSTKLIFFLNILIMVSFLLFVILNFFYFKPRINKLSKDNEKILLLLEFKTESNINYIFDNMIFDNNNYLKFKNKLIFEKNKRLLNISNDFTETYSNIKLKKEEFFKFYYLTVFSLFMSFFIFIFILYNYINRNIFFNIKKIINDYNYNGNLKNEIIIIEEIINSYKKEIDNFNYKIKKLEKQIEFYNQDLDLRIEETALSLLKNNEKLNTNYKFIDSLRYAKKIQLSIFPEKNLLNKYFSSYFSIWKPLEIVSGDFYYAKEVNNILYFALIDCTGHGIPGAFLSIKVYQFLENILSNPYNEDTGQILTILHKKLRNILNKHESNLTDDGLEIAIFKYNPIINKLIFSNTKIPMYLLDNQNNVIEIYQKQPSLGYLKTPYNFNYSSQFIDLEEIKSIYLTTDGIIKQPNKNNNKRFSKKRFKELIKKYSLYSMHNQKNHFLSYFNNFFDEQRDDITIIGIDLKKGE
ncbi:serine phosphatase RsbU (regulator of sigma subunit) [Hypnocyclicus thermotrophus]|uniref:Serine phosphatase RsbU (Regulator of sigma subunit) n=1 Tax=Hypnocyclicus thermotrophus TaxID=1627895 RepID=A0AA46I595_9FUSO|nr:SpoIIE family protein phosphatase [Hypnocyclicus thermotrophus]TDT69197.1 serine phosphatase RsbU (regulator of sigma subunit) [Hypnocyclicus thermotrophus]